MANERCEICQQGCKWGQALCNRCWKLQHQLEMTGKETVLKIIESIGWLKEKDRK